MYSKSVKQVCACRIYSLLGSRDDHLVIAIFPCVCTKYVYTTGELFLLKKEDAAVSPFLVWN